MTPDDEFLHLVADARAADAARSRAGVGALRSTALEEATVAGVLLDLADLGATASLLVAGTTIRGTIVDLWSDGVVLVDRRTAAIVRVAAISVVVSSSGARVDGDRRSFRSGGWGALLTDLVEPDEELSVLVRGRTLRGTVVSIGRAVIVLAPPDGSMLYVDTDAIDAVLVSATR